MIFPHSIPFAAVKWPDLAFPANKRPMAGRQTVPVCSEADGIATILQVRDSHGMPRTMAGGCSLRICSAYDELFEHRVRVVDPETGELFGTIKALFAAPGEIFPVDLPERAARRILEAGVALQLEDGLPPFWLVVDGPHAPDAVQPHLLVGDNQAAGEARFLELFCSGATLQPCNWMAACVWDGLNDWAMLGHDPARDTLAHHMAINFPADGGFIHENFRDEPMDNRPAGYENHGPFALLVKYHPEHAAIGIVEEAFEAGYVVEFDAVGECILAAETSYAVAYPMVAFAHFGGPERAHWLDRGLRQLRSNRRLLATEDDLYLRYHRDTGERTFRNWSRGVAWYFLGLVRTLTLLPADKRPADLVEEAERVAQWVGRHQSDEGLWPCYLKEPDILPDTSGSAGIAAAIAVGVQHGILSRDRIDIADRAQIALMRHLTPDGWLTGVAQSNKSATHAMDIQRSRFRVIGPWGMGMLAQLLAAQKGLS